LTEVVIITLGSNINPIENLQTALRHIRSLGVILGIARVYQNPALGPDGKPSDQTPFMNTALCLQTDLDVLPLRESLRQIEAEMGRVRSTDKFAAREIDLDICMYGERVFHSNEIILPDPDLITKAHLAIPVAELVPEMLHPVEKRMMREIAEKLSSQDSLKEIQLDLTPGFHPGRSDPDPS
jgi:2-amino-4-hydroxy-6-hydroxymethyldihydropteridine diphosphokinase